MNEFRVFAFGESFDPDSYLKTSPIKYDRVWHKGEDGPDHPKSSGIYKILGEGQKLTIFQQQEIASKYLSENRDELRALAQHPDITTFVLGLQYHIELDESTIGFCMTPTDLIMRQALEIGIEITFYVTLDRRQEWECDCENEQDAQQDS